MDNQIHFEQTPYHHVYLKDRKTLELTGIKKIESFDSLEFLIETSLGYLNIWDCTSINNFPVVTI